MESKNAADEPETLMNTAPHPGEATIPHSSNIASPQSANEPAKIPQDADVADLTGMVNELRGLTGENAESIVSANKAFPPTTVSVFFDERTGDIFNHLLIIKLFVSDVPRDWSDETSKVETDTRGAPLAFRFRYCLTLCGFLLIVGAAQTPSYEKVVSLSNNRKPITWTQAKSRLNSHEDHFYLHKIFGAYCTLHYLYRYLLFYTTGSMQFHPTLQSVLTVVPHLLLPITSLFFRVLEVRTKAKPLIMSKEIRAHGISFTFRQGLFFYAGLFAPQFFLARQSLVFRVCILATTHLVADGLTVLYGKGFTTIRVDNYERRRAHTYLKRFYSLAQFGAIAALLLPPPPGSVPGCTATIAFASMTGIHYASFLMTLSRKAIIPQEFYHIFYTVALIMPATVIVSVYGFSFLLAVIMIFSIRTYGVDKYLLWGTVAVLYAIF